MQAGFRLVAEVGFEGLRLRQVAEDVGIDHSTLHHHFATKQDLVAAIAAYTVSRFWFTAQEDGDPVVRLRSHFDALARLLREHPELFTVTVELDLRARRDPTVRAAMVEHEAGWRQVLVRTLAEGLTSGTLNREIDPVATAELIIATVKGARLVPGRADVIFDQLFALILGCPRSDDRPPNEETSEKRRS
ncbi:TetR/AcrR family transcriptional regulator [Nonomuraea maritima]|uniref:TetR/AcrR family transcriptional regulator n=1 Tax=Nonomuraea maritima TaxID=683260 RepID=UPI0037153E8D